MYLSEPLTYCDGTFPPWTPVCPIVRKEPPQGALLREMAARGEILWCLLGANPRPRWVARDAIHVVAQAAA